MKKLLAALLAAMLLLSCAVPALADAGSEPDWSEYDALIADIKSETDFAKREALMHQAEEMLMDTGCIIPLYYRAAYHLYNDSVKNTYSNPYGFIYFKNAEKEGSDTLRICVGPEPDKLDPALNTSVDGAILCLSSFSGLYTYDAEGKIVPDLASGCESSEDSLTWTFTMRDGLKWSDGSDLTAKDFEYSWKRGADPKTGSDYSYMFEPIKGYPTDLAVSASEDGKTLTVELDKPCAYMLDLMAFPTFFAVPQAAVEAAPDWENNAGAWALEAGFVCSGPFMPTEWTHNQSMVYTKNPNYWDAENVKLAKLEFMLSDDDTAVISAFKAGDLDFTDRAPTDEVEQLKATPDWHSAPEFGTTFACFNVKSPLFDGKTVEQAAAMRRAISMLIDRQYIIDTVAQQDQVPANAFIPEGMADGQGGVFKVNDDAYTYPVLATSEAGDELPGYYDFDVDVDGARELLEFAGYKFDEDGMLSAETPLAFEYTTNSGSSNEDTAACIQMDLAEIGIEMTIRTCDWNVFLNDRKVGNFDFCRHAWVADFNDPINMLEMWTTDSGNNVSQFGR